MVPFFNQPPLPVQKFRWTRELSRQLDLAVIKWNRTKPAGLATKWEWIKDQIDDFVRGTGEEERGGGSGLTRYQCQVRWNNQREEKNCVKGSFSKKEIELMIKGIDQHGISAWKEIRQDFLPRRQRTAIRANWKLLVNKIQKEYDSRNRHNGNDSHDGKKLTKVVVEEMYGETLGKVIVDILNKNDVSLSSSASSSLSSSPSPSTLLSSLPRTRSQLQQQEQQQEQQQQLDTMAKQYTGQSVDFLLSLDTTSLEQLLNRPTAQEKENRRGYTWSPKDVLMLHLAIAKYGTAGPVTWGQIATMVGAPVSSCRTKWRLERAAATPL